MQAELRADPSTAGQTPPVLAAPLDVAWAWYVHMLSPVKYKEDFRAITGIIAAAVPFGPHHRSTAALKQASNHGLHFSEIPDFQYESGLKSTHQPHWGAVLPGLLKKRGSLTY